MDFMVFKNGVCELETNDMKQAGLAYAIFLSEILTSKETGITSVRFVAEKEKIYDEVVHTVGEF